jgi:hypothetical protein
MKKFPSMIMIGALSALALGGCGGGGGGGGATLVLPTKAVTTVYLFGNMSSNSTVASVQTSMTLPSGVLVNYTSPPGQPGVWPLKSGVVQASGPTKVSLVSGSFDTVSRKLEISLVNGAFANISASTTTNGGKGTEMATVNFTLKTPGTTVAMPTHDPSPVVGKMTPGPTVSYQNGFQTNFTTAFH